MTISGCLTVELVIFLLAALQGLTNAAKQHTIELNMPDVRPVHDETYLCSSMRMNPSENRYIVGFEANASTTKVHHILIFGCTSPGKLVRDSPKYVWECGEMVMNDDPETEPNQYEKGPICGAGQPTIIFGWALDAPPIDLPAGVGFKVGGDSNIDYLVLQVHYGHTHMFRSDPSMTDNSGINLKTVYGENHGITRLAGIHISMSYGYVPPGKSKHTIECRFNEDKIIHPFKFRTHTHTLGTKVAGYKKPANDPTRSILIGEHDPQLPQMFYPIEDSSLAISKGDRIYAYCDYDNPSNHNVYIGSTGNDEMCNFYMMYWIEGDELLDTGDCMEYNPH